MFHWKAQNAIDQSIGGTGTGPRSCACDERECGNAYAECEWNARASRGKLANDRHGAYSRSPPQMYALSNQFT